ncbi:MAG: hypothetical protein JWQ30_2832 [Sediminibacterium sp.]|nr:hypothetical protein [Sediminibacterium sp.]
MNRLSKLVVIMENKTDILQELRNISPLIVDIQSVNPFSVPAGYFEGLPAAILEKIRIGAILDNASADTYEVPAGYFEGLSANILSKIKMGELNGLAAELNEVAPLLNTISKSEVYTVPAGYFDQMDLSAVTRKEGKVITLRIARKWMQYAAAAVMAGILVTGAFLYNDGNSSLTGIKADSSDVSFEMNKVSEAELVTYLDNPEHSVAVPAATTLASEADLVDVKNNLSRLSDEELNQYLKENAEPFESAVSEKE